MHDEGCELRVGVDDRNDGVFATRAFAAGERVMLGVPGRPAPANHSHANQVAWTPGSSRTGSRRRSTTPASRTAASARTRRSTASTSSRAAPIAAGEEITFDYAMRNYVIEHFPARCLCGADGCRGTVTGWKDLPDERKAAYGDLVAPYLLEADEDEDAPSRL